MLALKNVTKVYGKTKVLSGASLAVGPKDCLCIVGEGGSGKSTILKLLVRADDPTSGSVEVDGIPLSKVPPQILQLYRRRIGISFQEPVLLMNATVAENIAVPLELVHAPANAINKMVTDLMKRLDIEAYAHRIVENCSMSERVLTSIARAVIMSPMILLADEPLQHLDVKQSKLVVDLFAAMRKHGTTVILFSRSADVARAFGARVVTLKNGIITAAAAQQKTVVNTSTTHRILEETEGRVHQILDHIAVNRPRPGTPKNDKKIRITSIGSGL